MHDTLYRVTWQGKPIILHVEFQVRHDANMGRRLWHYNALADIHTNLPVHSVVIYLLKDNGLVESPYKASLPDGRSTQRLDFETIKLWEIVPEAIEQPELVGLLPLLPLMKGGKKRETVTRMIEGLEKAGRQDLFLVGYAFSSLVFTADGDQQWLKARFFMLHDILKDTWVFQEVMKEGREEGLEKGRAEGLEKGRAEGRAEGQEEGLERALLQFVEARFPILLAQAKKVIEQKMSSEQVEKKLNLLYRASTVEEAQAALLVN